MIYSIERINSTKNTRRKIFRIRIYNSHIQVVLFVSNINHIATANTAHFTSYLLLCRSKNLSEPTVCNNNNNQPNYSVKPWQRLSVVKNNFLLPSLYFVYFPIYWANQDYPNYTYVPSISSHTIFVYIIEIRTNFYAVCLR